MSDSEVADSPNEESPGAAPALSPGAVSSAHGPGLDFVLDVPLRLTVEIGAARMLVGDVLQLDKGSVVELDRAAGDPADVRVNGRVIARGEITVVEDRIAVRLIEICSGAGSGDG